MSNLLKNLVKEDWWSDMSPGEQAAYIKRHPGSKKAQDAKKKEKGDDKPKSRDEKPNYDDDNYAKKTDDMQADVAKKYGVSAMDIYSASDKEPEDFDSWDEYESHLNDVAKKLKDKGYSDAWAADDEADDMKWDDAQDSRDAEDKKDAGIKPIKADADTKRMGDSIQRKIGGSKDPDRLELQGTQEASNGETIIQFKDKDDGSMVGVDAQGNIYEDGEKQNYGVDVSTQSDVFGADQNQQLLYKQKKARETGGQDPFARTGKELNKEDFNKIAKTSAELENLNIEWEVHTEQLQYGGFQMVHLLKQLRKYDDFLILRLALSLQVVRLYLCFLSHNLLKYSQYM